MDKNWYALSEKQIYEKLNTSREGLTTKEYQTSQKKYGKNAILKGMNLEEGATSVDRNKQIGGHKA